MIEQATRSPAVSLLQASHWRCLEGITLVKLGQHQVRMHITLNIYTLRLYQCMMCLIFCYELQIGDSSMVEHVSRTYEMSHIVTHCRTSLHLVEHSASHRLTSHITHPHITHCTFHIPPHRHHRPLPIAYHPTPIFLRTISSHIAHRCALSHVVAHHHTLSHIAQRTSHIARCHTLSDIA